MEHYTEYIDGSQRFGFRHKGEADFDPMRIYSWDCVIEIANQMRYFSDTIYYFISSEGTPEQQREKLRALCFITNSFIKLPALNRLGKYLQIVLSGAIAHGPISLDLQNNIFCGIPIIQAYDLANGQEWMGAMVHQSVDQFIEEWKDELVGFDKPLYRYDKALKEEYLSQFGSSKYSFNWVQSHHSLPECYKDACLYKKSRPFFNDLWGGNVRYYGWGEQKEKCTNTRNFVQSICDKYDASPEYGLKEDKSFNDE